MAANCYSCGGWHSPDGPCPVLDAPRSVDPTPTGESGAPERLHLDQMDIWGDEPTLSTARLKADDIEYIRADLHEAALARERERAEKAEAALAATSPVPPFDVVWTDPLAVANAVEARPIPPIARPRIAAMIRALAERAEKAEGERDERRALSSEDEALIRQIEHECREEGYAQGTRDENARVQRILRELEAKRTEEGDHRRAACYDLAALRTWMPEPSRAALDERGSEGEGRPSIKERAQAALDRLEGVKHYPRVMDTKEELRAIIAMCSAAPSPDHQRAVAEAREAALRKLVADVAGIREDLREFDGDRRGHVAALQHAEEVLAEAAVLAFCPRCEGRGYLPTLPLGPDCLDCPGCEPIRGSEPDVRKDAVAAITAAEKALLSAPDDRPETPAGEERADG